MLPTLVALLSPFTTIISFFGSYGQSPVSSITVMAALLCLCMFIGHLLEKNKWLTESIIMLFLGLCTGAIILISSNPLFLQFDEELFFIYLLPPIIFNAGFQMKKKQFFENFITIVLFGVVGVFISLVIIGGGSKLIIPLFNIHGLELRDFMALGVIFSSTDSVCTLQVLSQDEAPLLYSLVFGEGVVNDATSIVLFRALQNIDFMNIDFSTSVGVFGEFVYLYLTSTIMGILVGLASAYIIKKFYFGRHSTKREIGLMISMAYLSYMLAELFYLSGILSVFFCGIVMSHYTWHNVSNISKKTTRHCFVALSFIAETFIFLYVGMDALDKDKWSRTDVSVGTSVGLSTTLMLLVLLGRATFVFPLCGLSNLLQRAPQTKISTHQQVIIWWAGLIRGAVSIALAYNKFSGTSSIHATMITSTIIVVIFSTVVFGILTKPLVRWILPPQHSWIKPTNDKDSFNSNIECPLLPSISNVGDLNAKMGDRLKSLSTIHHFWRIFDDAYMHPMFGGKSFVPHLSHSTSGESLEEFSEQEFCD